MPAKKNTEGLAFLVDALKKDKNAVYADVKAAAEKKGLTVWPIMFGKAKLMLGYVKAGKGVTKSAKTGKRGRPVDGSSKSGQVRALLSSGMSPAEIAKKVGCTVGLVYNLKSTSGMAVKRGPERPRMAAVGGPGRPRKNQGTGLNGLGEIVAAVQASQRDLGRYRDALTKIQAVLVSAMG
jgi:hypothetical protein